MPIHRWISLLSSLALISLAVSAGCGDDGDGSEPDPPDAAVVDAAPNVPDAAEVDAGPIGGDRPVTVHVPASYQDGTPTPLVILLHGYSATGALQEQYFQLTPQADARGFIYAIADGTEDVGGRQFWNATDACCDLGGIGVDDSSYLRSVIEQLQAAYTIDPKKIYFVGHSNGGFMSHRMACDHADLVAAIVSLAGAVWDDISLCQPSEPVSVLQIHGTADTTILFGGGLLQGNSYPGAIETMSDWADLNGCDETETQGDALDLDTVVLGDETLVIRRETGCDPGGHAERWSIVGGGHIPPLSAAFAPGVIDFLLAHPKP